METMHKQMIARLPWPALLLKQMVWAHGGRAINASQKRRHLQVRKDGQGSATFHTEGKAQVRQEDESVGNKRRG